MSDWLIGMALAIFAVGLLVMVQGSERVRVEPADAVCRPRLWRNVE